MKTKTIKFTYWKWLTEQEQKDISKRNRPNVDGIYFDTKKLALENEEFHPDCKLVKITVIFG